MLPAIPRTLPERPGVGAARRAFPHSRPARFTGPGPIGALVVDAEEDFDWYQPIYGTAHSVRHMLRLATFQELATAYGAVPTYLLTYPILQDEEVVRLLRVTRERGECDLGIQLHPWVTPPFDSTLEGKSGGVSSSFAGNLPAALEHSKLRELCRKFYECFAFQPTMYRAGRYGFGEETAALLESLGFIVDCSMAPRTDFSDQDGPNFTTFKFEPFWFGHDRPLLEVPLCREVVGWCGALGPSAYRLASRKSMRRLRVDGLLSWTRCAERITLSPEGNNSRALKRLASHLYASGNKVFVVSFHSSSLAVGDNPYVRTRGDLHEFYDRLSYIFSYLVDTLGVRFQRLADMPRFFEAPPG